MDSKLFTPVSIGPLTLRNRTIRAAAFEGMCADNKPTRALHDYHLSVARGGIGMTTLAYAAVCESGLSFSTQLLLDKEAVPGLKRITDDIHEAGAAASIQIGHCGNMSHKSICHCIPLGPCNGFNLYSPTLVHRMKISDIQGIVKDFGRAVRTAHEAGFDAVEVHAGHGYLLSQFMSTWLNRRRDIYGGSFENRLRFAREALEEVLEAAAKTHTAVLVKMNMRDGFKGGMEMDESIEVARLFQSLGVHALILSGGYVSRSPMYVMRGAMPIRTLTHYMPFGYLKLGVGMIGKIMIPPVPFKEAYFLDDARVFRKALQMPLVYIGGLIARDKIDLALDSGFECVAMARALINDPAFVNKMKEAEAKGQGSICRNACCHANYCIGRMYTIDMSCHQHRNDIPRRLLEELERNKAKEAKNSRS